VRVDPERLAEIFGEAVERPAAERRAFLDAACGGASELRAEAEGLLAAYEQAGDFMDRLDTQRGAALLESAGELAAAGGPEAARPRVGPYRLLRELGRGGMGVVYLAERAEGGFAQRAAIKLVKRGMDSDAIVKRFLRERQILAGLEHPNVARLLDGGVTDDDQPYFAMEYVDGQPLTEYCDQRRLAVEDRLRLFEAACRAVQHAHGKLVVHRDLKPSNMLVTAEGQLKLLDFGIAKLLLVEEEGETATALTQVGTRLLTLDYAAPEQVRGEPITTATDVYALGVVLYELLTGRSPYGPERRTAPEMARAVCEATPRAPSVAAVRPALARRLRGDLDTIVLRALSKEPSRRYPSAEALAEDVRRHLAGHPIQARRETIAYVFGKFVSRHRVGVAAAVVVVVSLLMGLIGTAWQGRVAARERDRARMETKRAEGVTAFLSGLFKDSSPDESKGATLTAAELVERGARRIEQDTTLEAALQADLFGVIADISEEMGRYDQARRLAQRSVELARKAHGPEHPSVAKALNMLGWSLHRLGEYESAENVYREALAMRRRLLPPDSLEVAESLDSLALLLRVRSKLDEAEAFSREALAVRERRLGPEDLDTTAARANLADLLIAKGDLAAAVEEHRKVLAIRRKVHGDVHPAVAFSLVSLGGALLQQGDRTGAEAAHREALAIRRRVYGEEHPLVSDSLHHLAATLHSKGDLEGAVAMYRDVLVLERKRKGQAHRDVAVVLTNLAYALAQEGRLAEALPLLEQAAAMHRRVTGTDHPLLARTLEREGWALLEQGRPRQALPVLLESVAINEKKYGGQHPAVATPLATLARARAELGEPAEAERLYRQSLDVQRRARPNANVDTAEMLVGLGELLVRQNRLADAEPLLREALRQADGSLPPAHWRRAEVESALGACLWRLGRHEEGRSLLASGYERLRQARGEEHPATRRARRRLDSA
jgi:eukaryotic-like serine/threonine-protein kinase